MIYFVVPQGCDFGIREYLEVWGLPLVGRMTVLHYEDLPARSTLPGGVYILSALDQLLPQGRRLAAEVADQLAAAGARVLNHPARTLCRFDLLEELFRRGLNRHRAARVSSDLSKLRYPVFLREEHHHTSALTPLLQTPEALQAALGRASVRGLRLEDLLVVEFCDTALADDSYRKYAAYVVGTEIIPRALERGRSWALKHGAAEFTPETLDEERAYVLGNPHQAQLREIFGAARVDYGRIDYAIKEGVIETWEINLNPTIGRGSRSPSGVIAPEMQQYRAEARQYFYGRFQAAFEKIDVPGESGSIPISYRAATLDGLGPMCRPTHSERQLESLRRVFRPFRPLLDPIVRILSPLIAKALRRGSGVR